MKREVIICSAKNNTVTSAWVEDNRVKTQDWQVEIEMCKQRLAETDYAAIKIAEGAATREDYADLLAERQGLRNRICELEQLQQRQNA